MTAATGLTHGLPHRYTNDGCRCVPCTAAHTEYNTGFRRRRYERTAANGGVAPIAVHNESTYNMWGCRCEECKATHQATTREKRRKSKAAS